MNRLFVKSLAICIVLSLAQVTGAYAQVISLDSIGMLPKSQYKDGLLST